MNFVVILQTMTYNLLENIEVNSSPESAVLPLDDSPKINSFHELKQSSIYHKSSKIIKINQFCRQNVDKLEAGKNL